MDAIERAKKVIKSCETYPQVRVAKTFAVLAVKQKYGGKDFWETKEMAEMAELIRKKISDLLGDD